MRRAAGLIMSILICQAAGLLGSLTTATAIPDWYAGLQKPSFSPPNWLFGSVWIVLYTLMGVAAFLVYELGIEKKEVRITLAIFAAQLVLNAAWSFLFFGLRSPLVALGEILILWLAILLTIWKFLGLSKPAAFLLLPYLFWVSFAAILNFFIVKLN